MASSNILMEVAMRPRMVTDIYILSSLLDLMEEYTLIRINLSEDIQEYKYLFITWINSTLILFMHIEL